MDSKDLITAIKAGYSFFYIQTYEMLKTVREVKDIIDNYENAQGEKILSPIIWDFEKSGDPEAPLEQIDKASPFSVLIAKNYNWFLKDDYGGPNKGLLTWFQNRSEKFTTIEERKVFIICGDIFFEDAVPEALQKDFLPISSGLPDKEKIEELFEFIEDSAKDSPSYQPPDEETRETVIDNCKGLTEREIKNALSFGIIKNKGAFDPDTIAKIRGREIEKTPGLKLLDCKQTRLLGYQVAKEFVADFVDNPDGLGIILLGPAGTGKTSFAHNVGYDSNKLVILLELAQLMGEGLVGQAEAAYKRAIDVITANAPCIVIIDEIEKGLSGVGGNSTQTDGGTSQRAASQLLKFLSDDRPKGVYVIATCNNIKQLPPEWVRSERWDCAPFFVGLPNEDEQKEIFAYYQEEYDVDGSPPNMDGWSGAEIKSLCRIANVRDKGLEDASNFIRPISKTMKSTIDELNRMVENDVVIPASKPPKKKRVRKRSVQL